MRHFCLLCVKSDEVQWLHKEHNATGLPGGRVVDVHSRGGWHCSYMGDKVRRCGGFLKVKSFAI